ncbi:DNA polymerase II large subunit [uncultured archaeon]|nr:DNA polymerase II large subunit [uncultured archaeon]
MPEIHETPKQEMPAKAKNETAGGFGEEMVQSYFAALRKKASFQFEAARRAREKGKDACLEVECPPTLDLADRTENIIGPPGIAKRYRELYAEHKGDRNRTIFQIFREILEQKICEIPDDEKRLEQAVKSSLMLVTEGVVVAPLDGVPHVKISKNPDGSKYVDIYFAGPIRAAGGTATVFPLILGDYARQLMQLDRYKPTDDEVERYVEEINIYDEIITRQFKLKDDDVRKIIRGCPVCINGEPTEDREVNAFKNLERIPSNKIRGGMCLVVSEGIGLKAMKIMSLSKMLGLNWSWLEEVIKIGKSSAGGEEKELKPNYSYLSKIAAGRPIFSYPSKFGGFRLRYGRARNTCVMAKGIHPGTMVMLDGFLAVGSQAKVERQGKSAEVFPVDTIEGPIVKLKSGEVRKIKTAEEAEQVMGKVGQILFLGDMLIALGDFRKTAHPLMPAGYCEEWWKLELEEALHGNGGIASAFNMEKILSNPAMVDQSTAIELSIQLGVPLHPNFLHYYSGLSSREACELIAAVRASEKNFEGSEMELSIPFGEKAKAMLDMIGVPHFIRHTQPGGGSSNGDAGNGGESNGTNPANGSQHGNATENHGNGNAVPSEQGQSRIIIGKEYAYSFFKTFGGTSIAEPDPMMPVFEMLSRISGLKIMDKAGTFIGCRMGRPEAARPRKMVGDPMVLFPIGIMGGNIRSVNKAAETNNVESEIAYFLNPETGQIEEQPYSMEDGKRNELVRRCQKCGKYSKEEKCPQCGSETSAFIKRKIGLAKMLQQASANLRVPIPPLVKGVKGLINIQKIPEPLEKGILRARHNLHIFRDGTIRFELLNAPLTHFKPSEIGLSVEKARELGYTKDFEGRELVSPEQLCEIFVQDIIVNQDAGDFFLRVTRFVDEELERFYGLGSHYNYDSRDQLIGELFLGLAPHTSAAVVCRIIGYTKAKLNFAHPYFHLAKRRNADGDQDSIMLLMDALLNFSRLYLPGSRGGRMDAPLVFTVSINPQEIDDEVYEVETCREYPVELYLKSLSYAEPDSVQVPIIKRKIGKPGQYTGFGFTHQTSQFDAGPKESTYVSLKSMEEKMNAQAAVQGRIRAIDQKDALERVMVSHFMPDIIGNTRAFSRQVFRCSKCNTKYRRVPLCGKCTECGSDTIILTIAQGSVRKYLAIAKEMIAKHGLSDYLRQRIILIEREIDSVFTNEKVQQKSLLDYA